MIGTTNKEILQIDENSWKFPKTINFGSPSTYTKKFSNLDHSEIIIFDMSETDIVHSTFIGFLINLKQKVDRDGGRLKFHLSDSIKRLFNILKLYDFFME